VEWPRDDPRWFDILERCDPDLRGRVTDKFQFGLTILHSVAGSRDHMRADERVAFTWRFWTRARD